MPKSRKRTRSAPKQKNRLNPAAMVGQADKAAFRVMNDAGQTTEPRFAVVPIIAQLSPKEMRFVGTGFFVTVNGLFVTAGHVARELADLKCPAAILHFLPGNVAVERPLAKFYAHNGADVAIGVHYQMTNDRTGEKLTNPVLTLSERMPQVGEQLHTYAYPNSTIELAGEEGQKHKAFFNPAFYAGAVEEVYPQGRDQVLMPGPCFQTSIHLHGGSSEGPVFDGTGKVVGVNATSLNIATDVSFISCTAQILDLVLDDVELPPHLPQKCHARKLAELGHICVQ